jgi:hypothetical protein
MSRKGGFIIKSVAQLRERFWEANPELCPNRNRESKAIPDPALPAWRAYIDNKVAVGEVSNEIATLAEI